MSRFAPGLALGTLLAVPALHAQEALDDSELVGSIYEQAQVVVRLVREGDWEGVIEEARKQRETCTKGADAWFHALYWLVQAHRARWEPELLEREARATLAEAAARRARHPRATRSALGPLHPWSARWVIDVRVQLARLEQSRGGHELALGHLELVLGELRSGLPVRKRDELTAQAELEAGRSLFALGRFDEARAMLDALRDAYPMSRPAHFAAALLADVPGAADPYRGLFAPDPVHAERRAALRAGLPRARARLAAILGRPEAELPRVRLGVADGGPEHSAENAITGYDSRRPAEPPSIVVMAEALGLGRFDPEVVLLHELTHAELATRLGFAYERLPAWLAEGLVQAICGELEHAALDHLVTCLRTDASRYVDPQFVSSDMLDYGPTAPGEPAAPAEPMLVVLLAEAAEGRGVERFIEALLGGASVEDAMRAVTGLSLEDYRRAARDRADALMAELRGRSLGVIDVLQRARGEGARRAASVAASYLEQQLPPLAEGHVRRTRAEALELLGRNEEALSVWSELAADAVRHNGLVDYAFLGCARCLMRLDRAADARRLLEFLSHAGSSLPTRESAARMLARLAQKRSER